MEEEASPPGLGCSKPHLEKLTLGITRILESSPGVTEVTIIEKPPAERHMISSWEQKNNCVMPEDVKNFYLMTNGFHMTWSVKLDEHIIPLGSMAINSISKLTQLTQSSMYSLPNAPTLADLEDDTHEASDDQPEKPHFDSRSVIFELDSCNGNGKVCLVYKSGKPGKLRPQYSAPLPGKGSADDTQKRSSCLDSLTGLPDGQRPADRSIYQSSKNFISRRHRDLVPGQSVILAFSHRHLYCLLPPAHHPPGPAPVAVCLHQLWH
ncbi:tubulin polyglutamylase complex subunit 2 isoform X2 [Trachypithecus francoisi]|uniref:tubulin polyglutamylase complex subunit 2 isoform X2 n=1 Tax=Trachypithecus francoisi TaxID=54180 RepID=UPI00141A8F05|nr:tubulin polyglutamylase complex subunit 2 isoform X2 [Trachypithecus francoisi]XP_033033828.1 tubulin polyglutamylase complex subunit 2 isoform X2 [Trachypithecus francoisi]